MLASNSWASLGVDSDAGSQEQEVSDAADNFQVRREGGDLARHAGDRSGTPSRIVRRQGSHEQLAALVSNEELSKRLYDVDATSVLEKMVAEANELHQQWCERGFSTAETAERAVGAERSQAPECVAKHNMLEKILDVGRHADVGTTAALGTLAHSPSPVAGRLPLSGSSESLALDVVDEEIEHAAAVSVAALRRPDCDRAPRDGSVHSYKSQGSDAALDDGVHAMEEIIAVCINKVCKRRKFGLGNIWVVQEQRLVCAPTYQTVATESEKLQFFGDRCREITFALGEGLPGRTWATQEATWERNVQELALADYPRLHIAKACGVKTSFAVPFVVCGVVLAVCEFVVARELAFDQAIVDDVKRALSEALQLKVHLGLAPVAKKALRRRGGTTRRMTSTCTNRCIFAPFRSSGRSRGWRSSW